MTVGPAPALSVRSLTALAPRWCGRPPAGTLRCLAQVRAHGDPVPAVAQTAGGAVHVVLDEPLRGVAPGQSVVLYVDSRVVGSATIERTERAA